METGAYSRLWAAARSTGYTKTRFIEPTGNSLKLSLPRAELPADEIEWKVPETWGAFERNRGRAYSILYTAAIAYDNLLIAYDLLRKGGPDAKLSLPYKVPKDHRIGVGL